MKTPRESGRQPLHSSTKVMVCLAGVVWLLLCGGCETAPMKGTPFYSGDFGKRTGPVEQRMNLWPAVYYREPALSVLWPIFEFTDDHTAVRPLFSVYGLDKPRHEYNVLWPFSQFDQQSGDCRIFPAFWGDDYLVFFPLYWHYGHVWGENGGTDSLFPLWYLKRHGSDHYSFYCPWPLGHWWEDARTGKSGSMVFPAYWHSRDREKSQFFSLLWMDETRDGDDYWRSALPPFSFWWADRKNRESGSLVLPLYLQSHDSEGSRFFSLPWMSLTDYDGGYLRSVMPPLSFWWGDENTHNSGSMILPLYWHDRDDESSRFYSLLWLNNTEKSGDYFRSVPPLAYWWADKKARSSGGTVLPLFWRDRDSERSHFYSLLWWSGAETNGDYWRLLFPLLYQSADKDSSVTATLLWAKGRSADSDWQTVIPLAYWDRHQQTLISPLWAHWKDKDTQITVAPLALSWWTSRTNVTDLWLLGGMARASWGQEPAPQYVFPLYYRNPASQTLLTPFWARWKHSGGSTISLMPWTLSWWANRTNATDLWLLGGMAHASWGENRGSHYVMPLYYRDAADQTLLTPLFGWKKGDEGFFYPLTPLAGVAHSDTRSGSWAFPLYSHSQDKNGDMDNRWLLMLGGNKQHGRHRQSWFIPLYYLGDDGPLDSVPEKAERAATYGKTFWCLPFNWFKNECRVYSTNSPVASGDDQLSSAGTNVTNNFPLLRKYTRQRIVFPLWSYYAVATPALNKSEERSFVPVLFYDYRHEVRPSPDGKNGGTNDYTRARVLWRLWHYERSNGNVSVDAFPAITFDRKTDGFKKTSFLWRFYRYERAPDGAKKMDLLFLPVMR